MWAVVRGQNGFIQRASDDATISKTVVAHTLSQQYPSKFDVRLGCQSHLTLSFYRFREESIQSGLKAMHFKDQQDVQLLGENIHTRGSIATFSACTRQAQRQPAGVCLMGLNKANTILERVAWLLTRAINCCGAATSDISNKQRVWHFTVRVSQPSPNSFKLAGMGSSFHVFRRCIVNNLTLASER